MVFSYNLASFLTLQVTKSLTAALRAGHERTPSLQLGKDWLCAQRTAACGAQGELRCNGMSPCKSSVALSTSAVSILRVLDTSWCLFQIMPAPHR
jgi:hypothetical protein